MLDIPDMHDWTLVSIAFDWAEGVATTTVRNPQGQSAELILRGVTRLNAPRIREWGPSSSVNRVNGPIKQPNGVTVEIEMQSGDVIVVNGELVEVVVA